MRIQLHHAFLDGTTDLVAFYDLDQEADLDANKEEVLAWMRQQMKRSPPPADACWLVCTEEARPLLPITRPLIRLQLEDLP